MNSSISKVLPLALLVLFALLAVLVVSERAVPVDQAILVWVQKDSSVGVDRIALEVTALGSALVSAVLCLIATGLLWKDAHRSALLLWPALIGGWLLSRAFKLLFARERPDLFNRGITYTRGASYPSGHALTAVVIFTMLAYIIWQRTTSRAAHLLVILGWLGLILLVGWSRIYLGVHYPSDVAGGYLLGLLWALFCIAPLRVDRSRKR
jgi:undecaprenyl-diphosphatase